MKNRKKFWVVFLSVVLGLFVVLSGTYFATKLNTVSVEFRTRLAEGESRLPDGILDNVKDSAEFNYKDSVLFMDIQENIDKIEKSNPFIKVQQIVRKFPNKVHIYVSERVPKFRMLDKENTDFWYILDEDFKVLARIADSELGDLDEKTVELKHISVNAFVGDFLEKTADREKLNTLLSGVYGRTKDMFVVRSIDFSSDDNLFYLTMRTSVETEDGEINYAGGCVIQIEDKGNIKLKALKGTCVYAGDENQMDGRDLSQKQVIVANETDCIIKNQG